LVRDILIYGAGGAGRVIANTLALDKNPETAWKVKGFIDDTERYRGKKINGIPVWGGLDYLRDYKGNLVVTIVEKPEVRKNLILRIKQNNKIRFPVIINTVSLVTPFIEWGEGCILSSPYIVVSVNVKVGAFVYIGGSTRIGPDVSLGDFSSIFAGIIVEEGVVLGEGCVIGSGAIVQPGITIGDGSIIGGGSVVMGDIPPGVIAAGVPAKIIKKLTPNITPGA
jgi:sugar O-acyltransferase (sialic acid O-acetyltransferase NeuD family)